MKILVTVLAALLGLAVAAAAVAGFSYVGAYNKANEAEKRLEAIWQDNENILAQYGQKIREAAQIPAMQRDDLISIFTNALEARYGEDGSQAALQWIQEQNPTLDQATYRQLMTMIDAGRQSFQNGQTKLLDARRAYETQLGSFWTGAFMALAGYPKVELAKYRPISTARAQNAFETGIEEPISLRP